jgi:DNA-directed RNA polymerase subunit K
MEQNYTKFERARLIGARALQISLGAPPLVKYSSGESYIAIARRELEAGVIPLTVKRNV